MGIKGRVVAALAVGVGFAGLVMACVGDNFVNGVPTNDAGSSGDGSTTTSGGPGSQTNEAGSTSDAGGDGGSSGAVDAGPFPVEVIAGGDEEEANNHHACARMSDGHVYCWGLNTFGELGVDPSATVGGISSTPVLVAGISGATRLAAGSGHSCAIAADADGGGGGGGAGGGAGAVYCWGSNGSSELGIPYTTAVKSPTPVHVSLPGPAIDLAGGDVYTCAVLQNGDAYCWGADSTDGRLGGNGDGGRDAPTKVPAPGPGDAFTAVTIGPYSGAGVDQSGHPYPWGSNDRGQLGQGGAVGTDTAHAPIAAKFPLGANASSLRATVIGFCGFIRTASTAAEDGVYCWGGNVAGELGDVIAVGGNQTTPTLVAGFEASAGAVAVAAGYYNTCALFENGSVSCVGATNFGIVGNSSSTTHSTAPQEVVGLTDATQVSIGPGFACAVHKVGTKSKPAVVCWGSNANGQLGNGTTDPSPTPVEVLLP